MMYYLSFRKCRSGLCSKWFNGPYGVIVFFLVLLVLKDFSSTKNVMSFIKDKNSMQRGERKYGFCLL